MKYFIVSFIIGCIYEYIKYSKKQKELDAFLIEQWYRHKGGNANE